MWRFLRGETDIEKTKTYVIDANTSLEKVDKAGMHLALATHFSDLEKEWKEFEDSLTRCINFNDGIISYLKEKDKDKASLESEFGSLEADLKTAGFGLCTRIAKRIA